jgi:hypothetical protein
MVSARKDHNRRDSTNLHSYRQVVLLYRLVVQGVVHFDVRPREAVVRPLLQVESVVFVCLRGGSGHQTVENSRVVFYTGTNGGKKHLKSRVGLDRGAPMLETLSRDHDQKAKFQKKTKTKNWPYKNSSAACTTRLGLLSKMPKRAQLSGSPGLPGPIKGSVYASPSVGFNNRHSQLNRKLFFISGVLPASLIHKNLNVTDGNISSAVSSKAPPGLYRCSTSGKITFSPDSVKEYITYSVETKLEILREKSPN